MRGVHHEQRQGDTGPGRGRGILALLAELLDAFVLALRFIELAELHQNRRQHDAAFEVLGLISDDPPRIGQGFFQPVYADQRLGPDLESDEVLRFDLERPVRRLDRALVVLQSELCVREQDARRHRVLAALARLLQRPDGLARLSCLHQSEPESIVAFGHIRAHGQDFAELFDRFAELPHVLEGAHFVHSRLEVVATRDHEQNPEYESLEHAALLASAVPCEGRLPGMGHRTGRPRCSSSIDGALRASKL